jgi:hypothetical protein
MMEREQMPTSTQATGPFTSPRTMYTARRLAATTARATGKTYFQHPSLQKSQITSSNVLIIEYSTEGETPVVCETLAYLGFPTYQLELTPTEEFHLVYLSGTERELNDPPVRIHPDWILAGWSADRVGSIPASRAASRLMIDAISATPELELPEGSYQGAGVFQTHAVNLGLSLVTFSTSTAPPDNAERPATLLDDSQ